MPSPPPNGRRLGAILYFAAAAASPAACAPTAGSIAGGPANNANVVRSPSAPAAPAANGNGEVVAAPETGLLQGGTGWEGDVNVAATSQQYHALTLNDLLAKHGPLARALGEHPEVEAGIRKVAAETGVPPGLLAGLCYQESTFDPNATSNNPNPSTADPRNVGLTQASERAFAGADWRDPVTNLRLCVTKYLLPDYHKYNSWGAALRMWNSGYVADMNDLRRQNNATDGNYIDQILGTHCMGR